MRYFDFLLRWKFYSVLLHRFMTTMTSGQHNLFRGIFHWPSLVWTYRALSQEITILFQFGPKLHYAHISIADACLSHPCFLGGTCVPNLYGPHECLCLPGSSGDDCSIDGTLLWRHNVHGGVSNHQRLDCLLNLLFRRRPKKTLKLRVTVLCVGNSPVTGEFPAQRTSNAENVSIWWRHHDSKIIIYA